MLLISTIKRVACQMERELGWSYLFLHNCEVSTQAPALPRSINIGGVRERQNLTPLVSKTLPL